MRLHCGWLILTSILCFLVGETLAEDRNPQTIAEPVVIVNQAQKAAPVNSEKPSGKRSGKAIRPLSPEEIDEIREEESEQVNAAVDVKGMGTGTHFSMQCPVELNCWDPSALYITVVGPLDAQKAAGWAKFPGLIDLNLYMGATAKNRKALEPLDLSALKPLHFCSLNVSAGYLTKNHANFDDDMDFLAGHPELIDLSMSSCTITPKAARNIASNVGIKRLHLLGCRFEGDALSELKTMPALCCLSLSHSTFSDDSLRALENCPKLRHLDIEETAATMKAFSPCKGWKHLEALGIRNTKIEGDEVKELGRSGSLRVLDAVGLKLTAEQIRGITKLCPIRQIAVSDTGDWNLLKKELAKRKVELFAIESRDDKPSEAKANEKSAQDEKPELSDLSLDEATELSLTFPNGLASKEDSLAFRAMKDLFGDWKTCKIQKVRIKDIEPEDAAVFAAVDSLSLELDWTAGDNAAASAAPVPPSPTTSGAPGSVTYAPSVGPNGVTYAPATPQPAIGKPAKKPKTGKLQNDFTRLFDGMGESPRLKELKISSPFDDLFDPQSFQFLEKLKFLEAISVQNVGADDRAAETLAKLPKLERLRLYGQAISDKSVEKLAQSSTIQFLDLSETSITDDCIDSLLKMKQLKELHALRTKLTPEKAKVLVKKGIVVEAFEDFNWQTWSGYRPKHGGTGI